MIRVNRNIVEHIKKQVWRAVRLRRQKHRRTVENDLHRTVPLRYGRLRRLRLFRLCGNVSSGKMSGAPPGKEAAVELTSGQARYLLAVYHLGLGARGVRCADIARMLDVTRPSVVKMLSFFSQRCLIARERYGKVYLTDTGCLLARCYARRLEKVERMLAAELALTREEAQLAACALLDVLPERCFTQGEVPSA